MTIVDLDFEEELKETNFPDLLEGEPTVEPTAVARKKVVTPAERHKRMDKHRMERQPYAVCRSTLKIVDLAPSSKNSEVNKVGARPRATAIDPPSSAEHDSTLKAPAVVQPKSTSVDDDELLDNLLGDSYNVRQEKDLNNQQGRATVHKDFLEEDLCTSRVEKVVKKATATRIVKRDFIEEVGYGSGDSRMSGKVPVSHGRSTPNNKEEAGGTDLLFPGGRRGYEVTYDRAHNASNDHASDMSEERGARDFLEEVRIKSTTTVPAVAKPVTPSDGTSKTETSDYSPKANIHEVAELRIIDDGSEETSVSSLRIEGEDDDDAEESAASSESSADAADLLERAQDRIARQRLQDEVEALKDIIERKNTELESLSGQLRRAVATKCDLVIAHNELEKAHENAIQRKENNLLQMKKANIWLLEAQSIKEKELLNEIIRLTDHCRDTEQKHREELDDWERMHRNEMLEKDFQIAKLVEELRQTNLASSSAQPVRSDSLTNGFAKYFLNQ